MIERRRIPGLLYLTTILIFSSCSEKANVSPTLEIVSPVDGSTHQRGEIIPIRAVAEDEDGSIIELGIFIEGKEMGTVASSSYVYNWDTSDEDLGVYVLSAYTTDDRDKTVTVNMQMLLDSPGGFNPDLDYGSMSDMEGNTYRTIELGNQVWMAENLKASQYPDGTPILQISDETGWSSMSADVQAFCWFNDMSEYRDTSGALYTWAAAMYGAPGSDLLPSGVQGVCPDGWHLPSDAEWKELELFLGMDQSAVDSYDWRGDDEGGQLKDLGYTKWEYPNVGASNSSGFTAFPGGFRSARGLFFGFGLSAAYWSSSEQEATDKAWYRTLSFDRDQVYRQYNDMRLGMSVRCVQD